MSVSTVLAGITQLNPKGTKSSMSKAPKKQVKNIRMEPYRADKKWYRLWKPKEYMLFIVDYTDGSGRIYKTRKGKK